MHTKPPVAVVGTRRPDSNGKKEAFKLALEFSLSGYPVVSGLALGIDRSAHEGALAAGSRCTWAVLAGGLDKPSPLSHRFLASKILDAGGALLGEVPPGQFPAKYAFPRRNRILSGLCRACVVVEAPQRSGALITANFALDQDRDVYVASSGVLNARFIGTCTLEEQGAPVVRGAADILKDWGSLGYFPTIQEVQNPSDSGDLIRMMQSELDDRLFRHTGGWFEFCSS